jgi:tetratricopeptide (TPR) repeat protein
MQTQDAPAEFLFMKLWPWVEANKNRIIGALAVVVVAMGVLYFVSAQREQREMDAGQALTMLMVKPPASGQSAEAFAQVASKYAGTAAGQRALLQAGAALFSAGKYADAQAQFQKFLDANPAGPLAATAQLGIAACLEAQNKPDAVSAYQRVISLFAGTGSVPEAEFALGRLAEQQNKLTEAETHYENAARAAMGGSLAQESGIRASQLKMKIAAAAPKPAAAVTPAPKPAAPVTATPAAK